MASQHTKLLRDLVSLKDTMLPEIRHLERIVALLILLLPASYTETKTLLPLDSFLLLLLHDPFLEYANEGDLDHESGGKDVRTGSLLRQSDQGKWKLWAAAGMVRIWSPDAAALGVLGATCKEFWKV